MQRTQSILLAIPAALLALTATSLMGDEHDKKTDVTISEPVQVPGGVVLQPGTYMFILNNSSSNRNIVEIKSEDGKQLYAMMFTTRAARVNRTAKTVLTFYEMPQGAPQALRQWFWPGDYDGQEFLYPHSQAVKIDQATNQTAPEVADQEYAKLNNAPNSASSDNQSTTSDQTVETATQTTTIADSTQQSVQSQPAQSDQAQLNDSQQDQSAAQVNTPADTAPATQTLAQNDPPASQSINLTPASPQDGASQDASSQNAAGASNTLPQTASPFPLAGLTGLLFLATGAALRFARQRA
jgi:hypothetical protein